jgi:hypothetical protein
VFDEPQWSRAKCRCTTPCAALSKRYAIEGFSLPSVTRNLALIPDLLCGLFSRDLQVTNLRGLRFVGVENFATPGDLFAKPLHRPNFALRTLGSEVLDINALMQFALTSIVPACRLRAGPQTLVIVPNGET